MLTNYSKWLTLSPIPLTHEEVEAVVHLGADAYFSKLLLEEKMLLSTVRALQRRSSTAITKNRVLSFKNIRLDLDARMAWADGKPVSLMRQEFALLHMLMAQAGKVVSRDQFLQTLYGWEKTTASNTLEVHMHQLRKKLGTDYITTLRSVGYMLFDPAELKT